MSRIIQKPNEQILLYIRENFELNNKTIIRKKDLYEGSLGSKKYKQFKIPYIDEEGLNKRITIVSHHISWYLYKGEWPTKELDHKDRDRLNNHFGNLREVTKREQRLNSGKIGKYGRGIKIKNNRYEVYGTLSGYKMYLGGSNNIKEAQKIYNKFLKTVKK